MGHGGRRPTSTDVELRTLELKYGVRRILAIGFITAVCIVASAPPLLIIRGMVEPLAGKTTVVDVSIVLKVSAAASLALNGFQWLKGSSRKRELKRARDRVTQLEKAAGLEP